MSKTAIIKFIVLFVIIVGVVFSVMMSGAGAQATGNLIDVLPKQDIYGVDIDYQDKDYVLMDVWATWCPPCVTTIPELQRLADANTDTGLMVMGISTDSSIPLVMDFIDNKGVSYPMVMMSREIESKLPNVRGIPTLFLYNVKGKLLWTHVGSTTQQALESELSDFLEDSLLK